MKNYRPQVWISDILGFNKPCANKSSHFQVLVLAGSPQIRPAIVDLANLITKHNSLMIVGNVVTVMTTQFLSKVYRFLLNKVIITAGHFA